MSDCSGTCTVKIFETRDLKVERKPPGVDDEIALRYLAGTVEKQTCWQKETGCEQSGCECTPLEDYLPDPKTGRRRKRPAWTAWRLRNVIVEYGDSPTPQLIFGTVESHSAIVPGLCELETFLDLPSTRQGTRRPTEKRARKR